VLHTDEALADIASSGIQGYEPSVSKPEEFDGLGERLKKHGLEMRSIYVGTVLHDEAQVKQSIANTVAIARRAVDLGCKIIVTNPSPIKWGGAENKTDAQLDTQAHALDQLGAELRQMGITLAYHNHDIEMRNDGHEFHRMLTATSADNVKCCLDAHWVYRGSGNSQPALFDALEKHGSRIVELHIRQSQAQVWNEVFTAQGDIDYLRLAAWLAQHQLKPHLVLEQCVEAKSPHTMDAVTAHRQDVPNVRQVFASL
jgi:inosose dehydratase